jgi:lipopolysaccharide export system protein LptC
MSQAEVLDVRRSWPIPQRRRRKPRGRLIDVLRWLLPAVALALIGLVVLWPQIMGSSSSLIVPIFNLGGSDQTTMLRMDGPRYAGQTKRGEPYELTAHSASLDPLTPNLIHLDQLAANLARRDGDVRLTATNGTYDRDAENVLLDGGIEVHTSSGYRFATPSAKVMLEDGRVIGRQPIEGAGPAGQLSANRFEIRDAGHVLRFEGRVKVTLLPQAKAEEPAAPPAGRGRSS